MEKEVKDVVEMVVSQEQGLTIRDGIAFGAGIIAGIVIPKVLRRLRNVVGSLQAKRALKKLAKQTAETETEKEE